MTRFPKDFVWGAASSAYQTEGYPRSDGGGESVWDRFSHMDGKIFENDNGDIACDGYHRFEEDLDLLAGLGIKAYRFSISWSRVDPLGDGNWNEAGLNYYDRVIDACIARGIEPYVTLFHWELPQALEDAGGWLSRSTAEAFARYSACIAKRLRGRVKYYFTLNEPQCVLGMGYGNGLHAPGKRFSQEKIFSCWKNIMLAHGSGLRAVKEADQNALVGLATTGNLCYPETESAEDYAAAAIATCSPEDDGWTFCHTIALDAACFGRFPACPGTRLEALAKMVTTEEWETMHAVPDYIGLNIYNGHSVRAGIDGKPVYVNRAPGFPRTATKWPVTPEVMDHGVRIIYERYGLPIFITENGQSCNDRIFLDGKVHDPDRIDFLTRYLRCLGSASEKVDLRGYFHWSLTDNFEWHSGYGDRFGLIYIDYPTQKRILKDSAFWYAAVAAENGACL